MTKFTDIDIFSLNLNGWVLINTFEGPLDRIKELLCQNLGIVKCSTEFTILRPKRISASTPLSLSSEYGLTSFPLHTDGAQYLIPPKYIILRSKVDSDTGTTVADARLLKKMDFWSVVETTTWTVKTEIGLVYTSIFDRQRIVGQELVRYNKQIMKCLDGKQKLQCVESAIQAIPLETIKWQKYTTLIIDNWRVLHGREAVSDKESENRIIERLKIFA